MCSQLDTSVLIWIHSLVSSHSQSCCSITELLLNACLCKTPQSLAGYHGTCSDSGPHTTSHPLHADTQHRSPWTAVEICQHKCQLDKTYFSATGHLLILNVFLHRWKMCMIDGLGPESLTEMWKFSLQAVLKKVVGFKKNEDVKHWAGKKKKILFLNPFYRAVLTPALTQRSVSFWSVILK